MPSFGATPVERRCVFGGSERSPTRSGHPHLVRAPQPLRDRHHLSCGGERALLVSSRAIALATGVCSRASIRHPAFGSGGRLGAARRRPFGDDERGCDAVSACISAIVADDCRRTASGRRASGIRDRYTCRRDPRLATSIRTKVNDRFTASPEPT